MCVLCWKSGFKQYLNVLVNHGNGKILGFHCKETYISENTFCVSELPKLFIFNLSQIKTVTSCLGIHIFMHGGKKVRMRFFWHKLHVPLMDHPFPFIGCRYTTQQCTTHSFGSGASHLKKGEDSKYYSSE